MENIRFDSLFPDMGEGNRVNAALTAMRPQNVKIGRRAWIGAGNVVTRNVEPNTIVVGPARVIRKI